MPDIRHTASTITDTELDGLYEELAAFKAQLLIDQQRLTRVRAELDRITALYANVTAADGRADSFATGARWTVRMVREKALDPAAAPTA